MTCFKVLFFLALVCLMNACSSIQPMDNPAQGDLDVQACNFQSHLKCIALTARETTQDGLQQKWTRHWFRMSYIGKACEKQYGHTTGVVLEGLFAIPHYFVIGLINGSSTLISPFVPANHKP